MHDQQNKDVSNYPFQNNRDERLNNNEGDKAEQKITPNPNPRANENIKDRDIDTDEHDIASQAGSEITDGEDG